MAQDYYMGRKPSVSRRAGALDPQLIKPVTQYATALRLLVSLWGVWCGVTALSEPQWHSRLRSKDVLGRQMTPSSKPAWSRSNAHAHGHWVKVAGASADSRCHDTDRLYERRVLKLDLWGQLFEGD